MRSLKLLSSVLILWMIISYLFVIQLYKKNIEDKHSIIANVLAQSLIQDTILNDQIKIKATISDFLKSARDVSFVCIISDGRISSYVGDAEINQRQLNEQNCVLDGIQFDHLSFSSIPIINNHNYKMSDLKIFWTEEALSFLWFKQNPAIFVGAIIFLFLLLLALKYSFNREQISLLEKSIIELVKNEEPSEYLKDKFPYLASKWLEMKNVVTLYSNERIKNEKDASIAELAAQVSHDIRSPLSALTMLMNNISELPENKRVLARNAIQRINDIANHLIEKSKLLAKQNSSNDVINDQLKSHVELIPAIVDTIISEKRLQFRDLMGVQIETELKDSYGSFAKIISLELKRVISNLVNNAVEAMPDQLGKVIISVTTKQDTIEILIKDNGNGIPKHILDKLGERGLTHGKEGTESGSGLGIYHAMIAVKSFGGSVSINSQLGHGTIFTISLPKSSYPLWFVDKINFKRNSTVIICDDDLSFHQIWNGRIKSSVGENIKIINFTNGELFKKWITENESEEFICLVDFELINQVQTGLDLIELLKIQQNSILVTSRYEEPHIKKRCENLKLGIIPKSMVEYIPISFE
jgi:signal transduction histidine kinase